MPTSGGSSPTPNGSNGRDNTEEVIAQFDAEMERVTRHKTHVEHLIPWNTIAKWLPLKIDHILTTVYHTSLDTTATTGGVLSSTHETIGQFKLRLIENFNHRFTNSPPFTVLRLAEILLEPEKHYSSPEKFLRALESVTCVSSTTADFLEDGQTSIPSSPPLPALTPDNDDDDDDGKVVPLPNGDESQTILLSRIEWLTDEDTQQLESDTYLADLTAPLDDEAANSSNDQSTGNHEEEAQDPEVFTTGQTEDDIKKRRADEPLEDIEESPEKKHKIDASGDDTNDPEKDPQEHEESTSTEGVSNDTMDESRYEESDESPLKNKRSANDTNDDPDDTLPEDRMDESLLLESDKTSNESIVMDDTLNDEVGNETLPEDKMDIDS